MEMKEHLLTYLVITKEAMLVLTIYHPLRPTAIRKLLEIIGRVRLYPPCSFETALDSDINQTTGSCGHLSMCQNRCMHAAVCLLRAGQPRSAGDAAKLGQFIGQFSWITGDLIIKHYLIFIPGTSTSELDNCTTTQSGEFYIGKINVTSTGKPCAVWSNISECYQVGDCIRLFPLSFCQPYKNN